MAGQSKEDGGDKPVDEALVSLCNMHAALNMFVSILNYTTRTELLKDLLLGDFAKTSAYMSAWTGVTALLEFLINPTLGSLSDVRSPPVRRPSFAIQFLCPPSARNFDKPRWPVFLGELRAKVEAS